MPVAWDKEFPTMFRILKGDYEDEYRLKKAGKVCSIQDVILKCVRRRMKKRLESGTLLELKKAVWLCALIC